MLTLGLALSASALTVGCAAPDDAADAQDAQDADAREADDALEALEGEESEVLEARVVGVSRDTSPSGARSGTTQVGRVTRTVDPRSTGRSGVGTVTRTEHETRSTGSGRTVRWGGATRR